MKIIHCFPCAVASDADIDGAKDGVSRAVGEFNTSVPVEDLTLHLPGKVM